jgi:DNA polymerase-4
MEKRVIHLNVADFAVAVERVLERRLRTRAVIISLDSGARSVVYDMSDEAYRDGVRKGMLLGRAKRLSRTAVIVPPKQDMYERAMKAFVRHALPFSPLVEHGEWDGHLFLDVTGTKRLFGPPQDIAQSIRHSVSKDISLSPIWGIASNKLVSKVATRLVKPFGECIVESGDEERFIQPVRLRILPGIYDSEIAGLRELNIMIAGQARLLTQHHLEVLLGNRARHLYETVRGIDGSPVRPALENDAVDAEHSFPSDTNDVATVESALYTCVERIGGELRGRGLMAKEAVLLIGYCDGARVVKRVPLGLSLPTNAGFFERALKALNMAWTRRVRLRHIRLRAEGLANAPLQLELFNEYGRKERVNGALDAAVDSLRKRFIRIWQSGATQSVVRRE